MPDGARKNNGGDKEGGFGGDGEAEHSPFNITLAPPERERERARAQGVGWGGESLERAVMITYVLGSVIDLVAV